LSVACGNLREIEQSCAVAEGRIGSLCALDQDAESLAVVASSHGHIDALEIVHGSVRDLLAGRVRVSGFDLIYAAGLYDYLPDRVAGGLMKVLASALNGGGELLVGNFMPNPKVASFLEAIGDWPLLWRSEAEVARLADSIPGDQIAALDTHVDDERCIAYVTVTRA